MKNIKINLFFVIGTLLLLYSCSLENMEKLLKPMVKAPGATIERNVKGHDQIYTVSAILRMSIPVVRNNKPMGYYASYGISDIRIPPVPLYQQIDISKDDDGQMRITSERKWFDVIKCNDKDGFYRYSLELKYYDLNGKMINYQFSSYDPKDPDGSNLLHHQHFFTIQNYSLEGDMMYYPTTLDGIYYDEFTFQRGSDGKREPASLVSASNVYVPVDASDSEPVHYSRALGELAAENATTSKATEEILFEGRKYRLYKTLNMNDLNKIANEIFHYEYRDTDPVDSYLNSRIRGVDDHGRDRSINNNKTFRLQQKRELGNGKLYDYLGFKGMLTFYKSNISFRMRICIAHMLTDTEKYKGKRVGGQSLPFEFDQISPAWNNYDIDYPLEFRVIADLDGDKEQFVKDVQKVYPNADKEQLLQMFSKDVGWYAHIPRVTM